MVDWNVTRRWGVAALAAIVGFAVLFVIAYVFRIAFVYEVFKAGSDTLSENLGLNAYLARAIVALCTAPLFWCVGEVFSFTSRQRRMNGILGLGVFLALYSVAAWWVANETYFQDGVATRYYADTPEGREFFDEDGFHPKYGMALEPVTPEIVASEEADTLPTEYESLKSAGDLFDRATGAPRVWYSTSPDGTTRYYSAPGFDPQTQERLKPVTLKVAELHRVAKEGKAKAHRAQLARDKATQQRDEEDRKLQAEEESRRRSDRARRAEAARIKSSVRSVQTQPGATSAGVLVRSKGGEREVSVKCEQTLQGFSDGEIDLVGGVFAPEFTATYFGSAFNGGSKWLRPSGVFSTVDWVVLADATWQCAVDSHASDLTVCMLILEIRAFDDANHTSSSSISQRGVGLSEKAARLRACSGLENSSELRGFIARLN